MLEIIWNEEWKRRYKWILMQRVTLLNAQRKVMGWQRKTPNLSVNLKISYTLAHVAYIHTLCWTLCFSSIALVVHWLRERWLGGLYITYTYIYMCLVSVCMCLMVRSKIKYNFPSKHKSTNMNIFRNVQQFECVRGGGDIVSGEE